MTTDSTYLKTGSPGVMGRIGSTLNQYVVNFATTNGVMSTIYPIFQCPEDYVVFSAGYEILIAGTTSGTLDLGKAGGTELLSAIAIDAAVGTKAQGAMAAPVFFSDSDTIDFQINTSTPILGKIRLWWVGCDVTELHVINDFVA